MDYIIVGASRGLGLALVKECLKQKDPFVIGIGRTQKFQLPDCQSTEAAKRFRYYEIDIARNDSIQALSEIERQLSPQPVCIIFNAALQDPDLSENGNLIVTTYKDVCDVGIAGFGHITGTLGRHLVKYGGILIGMSSTSSLFPPVLNKRIAYPATKAFLNMALRSLRIVWPRSVKIITVIAGFISDKNIKHSPSRYFPSYETVAEKIIRLSLRRHIPTIAYIPAWYCMVYMILNLFPDRMVYTLFTAAKERLFRSETKRG